MSDNFEYSMKAMSGGSSSKLAVSAASAQSLALGDAYVVVATPTVDVFFRRGVNPVALADGTDQLLLAGSAYRLTGFSGLDKLAFITSGAAGFVYLTPAA